MFGIIISLFFYAQAGYKYVFEYYEGGYDYPETKVVSGSGHASIIYNSNNFNGHGDNYPYKMWHISPVISWPNKPKIYYSYSSDGINWTHDSTYAPTNISDDGRAMVIYDENGFGNPAGPFYKLYHASSGGNDITDFRYAESLDGKTWTNEQTLQQCDMVLPATPSCENLNLVNNDPADYFYLTSGISFVEYNDSATNIGSSTLGDKSDDEPMTYAYKMYYNVYSFVAPGTMQSALAYSTDGIYWIRYGDAGILEPTGDPSNYYGDYAYDFMSVKIEDEYHGWFTASDGSSGTYYGGLGGHSARGLGHATSDDGINWIPDALPVTGVHQLPPTPVCTTPPCVVLPPNVRENGSTDPWAIYDPDKFSGNGEQYYLKLFETAGSQVIVVPQMTTVIYWGLNIKPRRDFIHLEPNDISVEVNQGQPVTTNKQVPVVVEAKNASKIRVSTDPTFQNGWQDFSSGDTIGVDLVNGESGRRQIYVQLKSFTEDVSPVVNTSVEYIIEEDENEKYGFDCDKLSYDLYLLNENREKVYLADALQVNNVEFKNRTIRQYSFINHNKEDFFSLEINDEFCKQISLSSLMFTSQDAYECWLIVSYNDQIKEQVRLWPNLRKSLGEKVVYKFDNDRILENSEVNYYDLLESGTLIKNKTEKSVYYYFDNKKYLFSNEETYFSWFNDYKNVKIISDEQMQQIKIGKNIRIKPGNYVKFEDSGKLFYVDALARLRELPDELVDDYWQEIINDNIILSSPAIYEDYELGDKLKNTSILRSDLSNIKIEDIILYEES